MEPSQFVYVLRGNGARISMILGVWFDPVNAIRNLNCDHLASPPIDKDYFNNNRSYVTDRLILTKEEVCDFDKGGR